ncbi:MAG: hypothetical protein HY960_03205 [Ignavibacteriae bacterium]|nr:hypothetical protein [Ignavibacteriota bacterium]
MVGKVFVTTKNSKDDSQSFTKKEQISLGVTLWNYLRVLRGRGCMHDNGRVDSMSGLQTESFIQ